MDKMLRCLTRLEWISTKLLLMLVASSAFAEEGMWMPQQIPDLKSELKEKGLLLNPDELANLAASPLGAIVDLGGCTGSFVSQQGLVLTNHHCVLATLQHHSTSSRNLLRSGFRAESIADELPGAPGTRLLLTVGIRNATAEVLTAHVAKLTGAARMDAIAAMEKEVIAKCEHDSAYRCSVTPFYSGRQYFLSKQLALQDLRLVYAPAEGVGKFGGETDNWMWPRHTGDFALYRAYVSKSGQPSEFNIENVAYRPAHYLRVARQGARNGDFIMAPGYPLRTNRVRLPGEIVFTFEWIYPRLVQAGEDQLRIIEQESESSLSVEIAYASAIAGFNNDIKNRKGMLEAYRQTNLLARREKDFNEFTKWVQSSEQNEKRYAEDIAALQHLVSERNEETQRQLLLSYATPRLLTVAKTLYRLSIEKSKQSDDERRPGFQERDWSRIDQLLATMEKRYVERVDKALVAHFLQVYLSQPDGMRNETYLAAIGVNSSMSADQIASWLNTAFDGTKLGNRDERLGWLERKPSEFINSEDTFIKLAVSLADDDVARERRDRELNGKLQAAYSNYIDALITWKASNSKHVYPDANASLRISFGQIVGREAGGADGMAWGAFTTIDGIAAKNTGKGEFEAPPAQIEAIGQHKFDAFYEESMNSVPVNFLGTLDVTGGNSGSPVLNARGELIGVVFDGTLDAVVSDWYFNPSMSRAIAVDMRYLLWQLKVVEQAKNLLAELQVQ